MMKKTKFNSQLFRKIEQQKGWTLWSMLFVIGVLVLFAYVAFQLVPVYTTNESIKSAMQHAIDNVPPTQARRSAITEKMRSKLYVDGNHRLIDYKKDVDIKRTQRELIVKVDYESRVPLFYNLSIVASFENEVKRNLEQ